MSISPLPGVYNQRSWPGVGDSDECWVIATFWALVAAGVRTKAQLPTIYAFRAACDNPDQPGATGGTNGNILKAVRGIAPDANPVLYSGPWDGFDDWLDKGAVASLIVRCDHLPTRLQYGFAGLHQIAVVKVGGKLLDADSLDAAGHAPREIARAELGHAAHAAYSDGKMNAVIIPAKAPDPHLAQIAALKTDLAAARLALAVAQGALDTARAEAVAVWQAWLATAPK